jgi:hypothetical protein
MTSNSRRVAATILLLLSSCAPDANGHCLGYVSVLFGFVRARVDPARRWRHYPAAVA